MRVLFLFFLIIFAGGASANTLHLSCPSTLNVYSYDFDVIERLGGDLSVDVDFDDQTITFLAYDETRKASLRVTEKFYSGKVVLNKRWGDYMIKYSHISVNRHTGRMMVLLGVQGVDNNQVYISGECEVVKQKF